MPAFLRRLISCSLIIVALFVTTALLPIWALVAFVVDRIKRPKEKSSALACLTFIWVFLWMELFGLIALGTVWLLLPLLSSSRYEDLNFEIQCWWARQLLAAAVALFNIKIEIQGHELAAKAHVLLPRHVSIGDTVFASTQISSKFGIRHRYVLKSELLWDPCIDICGHRLRCTFIQRGAGNATSETDRIAENCADLANGEGALIYPEGTRYSPIKRANRIQRLAERDPEAAKQAEKLQHTLYPHASGPYAIFKGAEWPDALFMAHSGFEGSSSFASLWRGGVQDVTVRIKFWCVPGADIPRDAEAFKTWLVEQWQRMDQEVNQL